MSSSAHIELPYAKMHGAGNDFIVIDQTQQDYGLQPAHYRWLADRHFGVGADQILLIGKSNSQGIDFSYRIVNADGSEVEHCGNGSRCFVKYVVHKGLTDKHTVKVQTINKVLELQLQSDGRVRVDMGPPEFEHSKVPFKSGGLNNSAKAPQAAELWSLPLMGFNAGLGMNLNFSVLSMGNPHAVYVVEDTAAIDVAGIGMHTQKLDNFPRGVNVGFMQIVSTDAVELRVYERGSGETLSCGTGACAAVVAGIEQGLLSPVVEVQTHGGRLKIEWAGGDSSVFMTGPAEYVSDGWAFLPKHF